MAETRRPKFVGGSGRGWARLEVSKSGQLSARESTANNSFPAFKSDTLHPRCRLSSSPRHDWNIRCVRLVTTFIKIVSSILLHSSFFFSTKEVTWMETFNGHYLNITDASILYWISEHGCGRVWLARFRVSSILWFVSACVGVRSFCLFNGFSSMARKLFHHSFQIASNLIVINCD